MAESRSFGLERRFIHGIPTRQAQGNVRRRLCAYGRTLGNGAGNTRRPNRNAIAHESEATNGEQRGGQAVYRRNICGVQADRAISGNVLRIYVDVSQERMATDTGGRIGEGKSRASGRGSANAR